GPVQVVGIEGNAGSFAVSTNGGSLSSSTALTVVGNSMNYLGLTSLSGSATGSVTLRPFTNGTGIDLGQATDTVGGPLALTDAELDLVTAGTINIGDANSGPITISAAIDRAASSTTAINLTTGGN